MPSTQTILITGGGSGIGRDLAILLASASRRIVAVDLNADAARATQQAIKERGYQAEAFGVDVSSAEQVAQLFALVGDVDVLINNAGLQHVAAVESFPIDKWQQLIAVMLTGSFLLTRAALPGMRRNGFGRVISIGSIHSLVASPFKSAYVAAKHGLVGFTKTLALETSDVDITANLICPAYVRTPLVDSQIKAQAEANKISVSEVIEKIMLAPMPKKQFITVEEIAATAEFLISPAARNITGQTITIDGGWTAR